jgi:hypothetical protein
VRRLMQGDCQQYRQGMGGDCLNYFIETHQNIVSPNLPNLISNQ